MFKRIVLIMFYLFMSACAQQSQRYVEIIPVEERHSPPVDSRYENAESSYEPSSRQAPAAKETTPVIVALADEAQEYIDKGDTARASSTLERALRIEPRNASLWHQLARVRLQEQQWQQAIALARKSNALITNQSALRSDNWSVIEQAYLKLGDKEKAAEARSKQSGRT